MKEIKTYEEYQNIYWNFLDRICEIEDIEHSKEYWDIIKQIDEMKKKYPKFNELYDEWVEKTNNEYFNSLI